MTPHDNQFQMYADAVKNELECAYKQGRADAFNELIKYFSDEYKEFDELPIGFLINFIKVRYLKESEE